MTLRLMSPMDHIAGDARYGIHQIYRSYIYIYAVLYITHIGHISDAFRLVTGELGEGVAPRRVVLSQGWAEGTATRHGGEYVDAVREPGQKNIHTVQCIQYTYTHGYIYIYR